MKPSGVENGKEVWTFSHTQFQTLFACPRKYYLSYIKDISPIRKSSALLLGTAVHAGLEAGYAGENPKKAIQEEFKPLLKKTKTAEERVALQLDCARAVAMAKGYIGKFMAGDRSRFQTMRPEQETLITVAENDTVVLKYKSYLDGLHTDKDGDWTMEHKTAGRPNHSYMTRIKLDWQVLSYAFAAKSVTGRFPRGCIYNIIKKTQIRRKAGESIKAFEQRIGDEYRLQAEKKGLFIREEFLYSKKRLMAWKKMAKLTAIRLYNLLAHHHDEQLHWVQNTGSCLDYSACSMLNLCASGGKPNPLIYEIGTRSRRLAGK